MALVSRLLPHQSEDQAIELSLFAARQGLELDAYSKH